MEVSLLWTCQLPFDDTTDEHFLVMWLRLFKSPHHLCLFLSTWPLCKDVQRSQLSPKVQWILLTERPVVGQVTLRGCHWSDASHGKNGSCLCVLRMMSCQCMWHRVMASTDWKFPTFGREKLLTCLMPPDVCCNMRLKLIPGPIGFRALQLFEDRSVLWLFYSFDSFLVVFQKDLTWSDPADIDTGMT